MSNPLAGLLAKAKEKRDKERIAREFSLAQEIRDQEYRVQQTVGDAQISAVAQEGMRVVADDARTSHSIPSSADVSAVKSKPASEVTGYEPKREIRDYDLRRFLSSFREKRESFFHFAESFFDASVVL